MNLAGGSFSFGGGGGTHRSAITGGRIKGGLNGVNYPSPFFDIAHTYLPVTVKQMFRWCRYYFLTNPLINATVFKLSEYPITDIVIDHPDSEVRNRWLDFFQEQLLFRSFQIDGGLDYNCYGNMMSSVGFPFHKYLRCQVCRFCERADKIRNNWTFTNFTFRLACPKCFTVAEALPNDLYIRSAGDIRLIRWNCENVEINFNEITGNPSYFYTIPAAVRNDALIGRKEAVEALPQVFIQAMREQKGVTLSKSNFFHMKRATLAQQDRGWGIPLLLPVLKDTFYLQLMKKAQEAILLEHIVPLRVLFPQAGSGSSDPYTTINLEQWREQVANEIGRWRLDQNYIPILPLPIGHQTIGGDGRALLLTQELQAMSEQILVGMGVPREFVFGGMSYAGTNVSMRMLENGFLSHILRQKQLANWIVKLCAPYLDWPEVKVRFKPFKMADDIQRKAFLFQLKQANEISSTTLLADSDLDQDNENRQMLAENNVRMQVQRDQQLGMANIQAEAQAIIAKAQVKAQQVAMEAQGAPVAPGEPGDGGNPAQGLMGGMQSDLGGGQDMAAQQGAGGGQAAGTSLVDTAQMYAQQISMMDPAQQQMMLQQIEQQSPELAQLVAQLLQDMGGGEGQPQTMGGAIGQSVSQVDMRPLPEQRGPRRVAASV